MSSGGLRRPEEAGAYGAGVAGSCEPPDVGAGNGTQVLCKGSIEPSLQPFTWLFKKPGSWERSSGSRVWKAHYQVLYCPNFETAHI